MQIDHRLERLLAQESAAAFILDPQQDRFVAANRVALVMLGYTREELLTTPVSRIHPGELPQLQRFVGTVLHDGRGSTLALTYRTRSGGCLPVEMSAYAFEDDDGHVYLLGLVRDRSEHRRVDPCG